MPFRGGDPHKNYEPPKIAAAKVEEPFNSYYGPAVQRVLPTRFMAVNY